MAQTTYRSHEDEWCPLCMSCTPDLARHPCIMAENYATDESPHFTGQVIHNGHSYAWAKVYNLGEARHEEESLEADAGVAIFLCTNKAKRLVKCIGAICYSSWFQNLHIASIIMIVKRIHCGVLKITSQVGGRPFATTVTDGWTREERSSQLGLHVGCALAPTIPSIIETNTRTTVEMRIVIREESRTKNNDLARRAFIMAENYTTDESPHLTGQVIHIFRGYAWSKVHNLGEARHEEECTLDNKYGRAHGEHDNL
ncbi:hypothetical protein BDR06DRAFT_969572 [Suillus hirtellus]|nr:hypothetical protein BDR06DRAFT_969572 [Suillus hirtellus]